MPTVVVSWSGQAADHKAQEDLCGKLAELAEISCRMYAEFFKSAVEPRRYDGLDSKRKMLVHQSVFHQQTIPAGLEQVGEGVYLAPEGVLYGLEFTLFDPRRHNSPLMEAHTYDLSFVFLRSEHPGLDGWVARVGRVNPAHSLSQFSDTVLDMPQLDLRYYLESWIGELLGWVKHFYMPNLWYWRWGDYPGYLGYEQYAPTDRRARDEIFWYLRDAFVREAEAWTAYMLENQKRIKPLPKQARCITVNVDLSELEDEV